MTGRFKRLRYFLLLIPVLFMFRLFHLQVQAGEEFREAADNNRIRVRSTAAPRGRIFDKNGVILAENRVAYDFAITADNRKDTGVEKSLATLGPFLRLSEEDVARKLSEARKLPGRPVVVQKDIDDTLLQEITWNAPYLKGIEIRARPVRMYPLDSSAAHVIGYLGEVTRDELDRLGRSSGYRGGDLIGKIGLEKKYDAVLKGERGLEQYEADPLGQPLRSLGNKPAVPGKDLHLTIDYALQKEAELALEGMVGAVVGIEPSTGKIVIMASNPTFSPEVFIDEKLQTERIELLRDRENPLVSRALNGLYPPASTFKLVLLVAGMESGRIDPNETVHCGGSYMGQRCWKLSGHGHVDMIEGFAQSCGVYYFKMVERIGIDLLRSTAIDLGIDGTPGLGIGSEQRALVPSPEWERENVPGPDGQHWGGGDLRNTSIGQGYVLATPFHVARAYAMALTGGAEWTPSLVDRIGGTPVENLPAHPEKSSRTFSPETQRAVRQAMLAVVETGTGARLRSLGIPIGAKTGTGQNPHGEHHAWMVAAFPLDDAAAPELVVSVLVVNGGSGSSTAGPIVKRIAERWLKDQG